MKAAQAEAVAEGDTQKFAAVDQQIEHLRQNPPSRPNITPPDPAQDPVFQEWSSENSWYGTDPELTAYADRAAGPYVRGQHPNLPPDRFLSEVEKEVKKRFPEKFGVQSRPVPTVEGARSANPRPTKGKSYKDLPADAKAACDKFVKQGLLKREEYVRDFFGE